MDPHIQQLMSHEQAAVIDMQRRGTQKVKDAVMKLGTRVSKYATKFSPKSAITIGMLLLTMTQQMLAMSGETKKHFYTAIHQAQHIQALKQDAGKASEEQRQKIIHEIEQAMEEFRNEYKKGMNSFDGDISERLLQNNQAGLRNDIEKYEKVALEISRAIGDTAVYHEAKEYKKLTEHLIDQRLLMQKDVEEALNYARNEKNIDDAVDKIDEILKIVKKYEHLGMFAYVEGAYKIMEQMQRYAQDDSRYGRFEEAENMLKEIEKLANHETIRHAKKIAEEDIITPLRKNIAEARARKVLEIGRYAKEGHEKPFEEAEELLKESKGTYSHYDSLFHATEYKLLEYELNMANNLSSYEHFKKAKDLLNHTQKKFPSFKKEISDASFKFGMKIRDRVEELVRYQKYEDALEFLEFWEQNHFGGRLKKLRENIRNKIKIQAKTVYDKNKTQEVLTWANKFY